MAGCLAALTTIVLLLFADLLHHPSSVLWSNYSDAVALHLPSKRFLVRAWQETGSVPLWCPYVFGGMPFVHDVQSSAFYPPHALLYLLPEERVGAVLSWLVVLHVLVAGVCMLAYARSRGLSYTASFVAGVGYMLAGKWMLHLLAGGHFNMAPLAWLPLVLLCFERALQRGNWVQATWAGALFSLLILGAYPYVTLYAAMFVALWSLAAIVPLAPPPAQQAGRAPTALLLMRWAGMGVWSAAVAAGLAAVQLLPSWEASHEASRGLGVAASLGSLMDGLRCIPGLVGPPLSDDPSWIWENRVAVGVLWVAAALIGATLGGRGSRWEVIACGLVLLFGLGGAAAVQGLPGFRLFQLPSRAFLLLALPLALFAGRATDQLFGKVPLARVATACDRCFVRTAVACLTVAGATAMALAIRGVHLRWDVYWLSLFVTLPLARWLIRGAARSASPLRPITWAAILTLDAVLIARPWIAVKEEAAIYAPSPCVRHIRAAHGSNARVLDFAPAGYSANATPFWPGLSTVMQVDTVRGFNPVDVLRFKKYLQFVAGIDEPLRPLDRMFTSALLGAFPIRNQSLAELLGIRFLVQPQALPLEATVLDGPARRHWRPFLADPAPRTFNFVSRDETASECGLQPLPPYRVYENASVLPRAFVVPEAVPAADENSALEQLRATDFRQRVLLAGFASRAEAAGASVVGFHPARVTRDWPNEVDIEVGGLGPGYLVLTDVWYPGWKCAVDGRPADVYRANYLFRGVPIPPGAREVSFCFEPRSYTIGKAISQVSVLTVGLFSLIAVVRARNAVWAWRYTER